MATSVSRERGAFPSDWLRHFVDEIPAGIAVFDPELRYVAANPRWINAFRLASATLSGRRHDEIGGLSGLGIAELQSRALAGDTVEGYVHIEIDGVVHQQLVSLRPRVTTDGTVIGVLAALHEIAAAANQQVIEEAPDQLTGIAGRATFLARVGSVLEASATGTAMFLLDIDNFKGINDLYGARVGDAVLKTVATRLITSTRSRALLAAGSGGAPGQVHADLVTRLGADEFGIVLSRPASPADAEIFARRLLQVVRAPILAGDQRIRLTASVGYLITGPAQRSEDDVLRDLDVALQEAKLRGPNSSKIWEPALTS